MFVHPMWDPAILTIKGFAIRWYGIAYLAAILMVMAIGKYKIKKQQLALSLKEFDKLVNNIVIGIIVGGRLGYILFYQTQKFLHDPIILFKIWQGGMSFHGGLIGVILAIYLTTKKTGKFWHACDFIAQYAPIGLALGRLANFVNGELCGRITQDYWWSIVYPWLGPETRHPSQLYEMLFEGCILFAILNYLSKRQLKPGRLSAYFCLLYASFRFMLEFFREPDPQLGFLWGNWLTMGQLLSIPILIIGLVIYKRAKT